MYTMKRCSHRAGPPWTLFTDYGLGIGFLSLLCVHVSLQVEIELSWEEWDLLMTREEDVG